LNIVIGGVAGAASPLIGWAAGADDIGLVPMLMFMVIFLWTPPHFWALALWLKADYRLARIPMLPVASGEKNTRIQIMAYMALLLPTTAYLGIRADLGPLFLIGTTLAGGNFVRRAVLLCLRRDIFSAQQLFGYSIFYLACVFVLAMVPKW
jgi:protoheme IX farnesyltransferase